MANRGPEAESGESEDMFLEAALVYASCGWQVFPGHGAGHGGRCSCDDPQCGSPGKHPRLKRWQRKATTHDTTLREWWSRWPRASVCIATGADSGLVVLDVDPRHGGMDSLVELIGRSELPTTPTVRTGGGGLHLYFKHPGGRIANRVGVLPGIDIRADGGFVVAPPSLHISGEYYTWMD